jgi:LPPG:FO 2-phospho-L-lactate transferase
MTVDPAPPRVGRSDGSRPDFEEYLVRDGAPDDVVAIDLSAAQASRPAPGVLAALERAETILICPSNPIVSIGTILAVPGVRERLRARHDAVGVSPIIGGAPVKGPADRLLRAQGIEVSARGVAGLYRDVCAGFVIDQVDADQAADVRALGMRVAVCPTLMRDVSVARALARRTLELARESRR